MTTIKETRKRWHCIGDINVEYGGAWIQESGYDDHVYYVEVTPCSDAGGLDNLFWIESGSVYLGNASHVASALEAMGHEPGEKVSLIETGYSVLRYMGGDSDLLELVAIGPVETDYCAGFAMPEIDVQLRGNASLKRYIRTNHLGLTR